VRQRGFDWGGTLAALAAALLLLAPAPLAAQGVQTGTLIGSVTSADGEPLPGATVTVTSSALQGERTTTTSVNGDYILRGLPPGAYEARFTLEGMTPVVVSVGVPLGGNARADAALQVQAAEETITVTGDVPSALETTTVGANFPSSTVDNLAIPRTILEIAELAPAATNNTELAGQITINGGMEYDNSVLINGVDVLDPVFGDNDDLYIEEAVQETQVLTSGISAEYGRFTGGVINVVTRSGGNQFQGAVRADFSKPEWRDETPFEEERGTEREGDLGKVYQAVLGGPILRDRLWFFLAGQDTEQEVARVLPATGFAYVNGRANERYEVKLTANVASSHSIQASYVDNQSDRTQDITLTGTIDPRALIDRNFPNEGFVVGYTGAWTNSLFSELRYSEKKFAFVDSGSKGTTVDLSPFIAQGVLPGTRSGANYNAAYFDGNDPEDRDNEQLFGAVSVFLASQTAGSHDLKIGAERFVSTRTGGNGQSPTSRVYYTDYRVASGSTPATDAQGRLIPVFTPGLSGLGFWLASSGAEIDTTTDTLFANDRWDLNAHWSFNFGARFEKVRTESTGEIVSVDTDTLVPRLGVAWDVRGDGKYKLDVTYAEYAGRYNPALVGANSPVGNPAILYGYYTGPAGQGIDFAPGFDPANYFFYYASVPTANVFVADNLSSPVNEEFTVSGGLQLPRGGYLKLTYVQRELREVIEAFTLFANGASDFDIGGVSGRADNIVIANTDAVGREFRGLQLQGRYTLAPGWQLEGNLSYQLDNEGRYEGQDGQSILDTAFGDYPEITPLDRFAPDGRFDDYQELRARIWTTYSLELGRFGGLDTSLLYRYDSPLTFSYQAENFAYYPRVAARDPGYVNPPFRRRLYFGDRGIGEYNSTSIFDLALNYRVPIWKSVEPWVKLEVRNLLNDDTLGIFDTQVSANTAAGAPVDAFGLPTTFVRGPNFGKATSALHYVIPREFFVSAGIRF
jgi:hypothetical protein